MMKSGDKEDPQTHEPSGMTLDIYKKMESLIDDSMNELLITTLSQLPADTSDEEKQVIVGNIENNKLVAKDKAKDLCHCIAKGVVTHLTNDSPNDREITETISSNLEDPIFWNWLKNFADAFNNWNPNMTGAQGLKIALSNITSNVPQSLKGVLK